MTNVFFSLTTQERCTLYICLTFMYELWTLTLLVYWIDSSIWIFLIKGQVDKSLFLPMHVCIVKLTILWIYNKMQYEVSHIYCLFYQWMGIVYKTCKTWNIRYLNIGQHLVWWFLLNIWNFVVGPSNMIHLLKMFI